MNRAHHYLPSQGRASSRLELIIQQIIKALAWIPLYTAIVATLTLLVVVFGVPFVRG